jgi:hypothetical protein
MLWGRLFDPHVRDNATQPFIYLRDQLRQHGYELQTADDILLTPADSVWFWDVPPAPRSAARSLIAGLARRGGRTTRRDLLAETLRERRMQPPVLFIWEPAVVNSANWDRDRWKDFSRVFTWHDDIADGRRFVKFMLPVPAIHPEPEDMPYQSRRLLANVSGNKRSDHPAELYTARRDTIRYCEETLPEGEFGLFGTGWDQDPAHHRFFRGSPPNKWDVYPNFRFGLCYENMRGAPGYVTEKIIDCIRSGTVPVYLGAPNVGDYVHSDAFIDRSRFSSDADLIDYLRTVDVASFRRFREAGQRFLHSREFELFLPPAFVETILRNAIDR